MRPKDVRKQVKIGNVNYDILFKSHITGNLGTYEELRKGKFHDEDIGLSPSQTEIAVLRERTAKQDRRLIVYKEHESDKKERCPYCHYARVVLHANGRQTIELGNPYIVLSSVVDRGSNRKPRRVETSKYCESCERTFVKEKVVVARYA